MQLDALNAFREVYERRSFAASGRALGVDPSVVSRRVKALERQLDVALFYRSTRAVAATAAADELYRRIAPALRDIHEAVLAVRSAKDQLRGTIRVAAPSALGRSRIGPVTYRFCLDHPEVRVELLLSDRQIDLFEQGIDLAIRPGTPGSDSLVSRRLGMSEQWVVAAASYLAERPPLAMDALEGHRVVLRRERGALIDFRTVLPEPSRDLLDVAYVSDDMGATADAVRAGLGFAVLPRWLVEDDVAAGRLVRLPLGPERIEAPVHAVLPAGRGTTARTRALLEALVEDWRDGA